jgi:hypothetical protein
VLAAEMTRETDRAIVPDPVALALSRFSGFLTALGVTVDP